MQMLSHRPYPSLRSLRPAAPDWPLSLRLRRASVTAMVWGGAWLLAVVFQLWPGEAYAKAFILAGFAGLLTSHVLEFRDSRLRELELAVERRRHLAEHVHRFVPSRGTVWRCTCGARFDPGCPTCDMTAGEAPHRCTGAAPH